MLYRFKKASTNAQLDADRTAVAALAPKKSLVGVQSWLKVRLAATRVSATFAPFIVAFGILGLVMSILVVGIVVGGAVAGLRHVASGSSSRSDSRPVRWCGPTWGRLSFPVVREPCSVWSWETSWRSR